MKTTTTVMLMATSLVYAFTAGLYQGSVIKGREPIVMYAAFAVLYAALAYESRGRHRPE